MSLLSYAIHCISKDDENICIEWCAHIQKTFIGTWLVDWKINFTNTVKLGYNELGYNEHSVITNKKHILVGLGHFYDRFSRL